MNVKALMAKARETNRERDKADRESGFAAPGDAGAGMLLRTAMDAIQAGMALGDWDCVAEGQAMLEQLHAKLDATGREYRPSGRD